LFVDLNTIWHEELHILSGGAWSMAGIDQTPPEQAEPLFRFVAFGFPGTLRWSPLARAQTSELRAYPGLIHIGGAADHLLKNVTDLRLAVGPFLITFLTLMYAIYWNWFFGGIARPFNPDHPWLWLVMILYSVLLLFRFGSTHFIQVTYSDAEETGEEQLAYLFPLNDSGTRRDSAIKVFLKELREVVLGDFPNRAVSDGDPVLTPQPPDKASPTVNDKNHP
jgi:hypothetical protein